MNNSVDTNQQNKATTMQKRVQFATDLAAGKSILHLAGDAASPDNMPSPSSRWYTSKELRAFRRDIYSSIDADKAGNKQDSKGSSDTCMRGLEIFASDVRRDLQKHYAKSVIEAQRRIKACKKRKRSDREEEDSELLQQVASKYSQYARERAYQAAARDEVDCRRLHDEESCPAPAKKQSNHKTPTRIFQQSRTSSFPSRDVHATPSRLGVPPQGR